MDSTDPLPSFTKHPESVETRRASSEPFGTGYKHRACRVLLENGGLLRKLCRVGLEQDGSVSVGLSDPNFVASEVGTSHAGMIA